MLAGMGRVCRCGACEQAGVSEGVSEGVCAWWTACIHGWPEGMHPWRACMCGGWHVCMGSRKTCVRACIHGGQCACMGGGQA